MTAYALAPGQSAGKGLEPPLGLEAVESSANMFFDFGHFLNDSAARPPAASNIGNVLIQADADDSDRIGNG